MKKRLITKKQFVRFVSFLLTFCIVISATMVPCFASGKGGVQPFGENISLSSEEEAILKYARTGFFKKKDKSVPPTTSGTNKEYARILKAWANGAVHSQDDTELALIAKEISKMSMSELKGLLKEEVHFPVVQNGKLVQTEESITVKQAIDSIVYLDVLSQYVSTLDSNLEALKYDRQIYSDVQLKQCVVGWTEQIKAQFDATGKIDFPSVWLAMISFSVNKVTGLDSSKFIPQKSETYEGVLKWLDRVWHVAKETNDYFALIDDYLPDLGFKAVYFDAVFSALESFMKNLDESSRVCYFLGYYYIKDHKDYDVLYDMAFDGIVLKSEDLWWNALTKYFESGKPTDTIVETWAKSLDYMRTAGNLVRLTEKELESLHYCVNLMRAARAFGESGVQSYKNGLLKSIGATILDKNSEGSGTATETTSPDIGDNEVRWSFDSKTKTLTISGNGSLQYTSFNRPWKSYVKEIEHVRIQEGITGISSHAFLDCIKLTEVEIPDSVTYMGDYVFQGCKNLRSVKFSCRLSTLGKEVFKGCDNLTELELPSTLSNYDHAFENCESLVRVVLQEGIEQVSSYAFRNCKNLVEVKIPSSVYHIGSHAFEGCKNLKKLKLPDNLTYVGSAAFNGCGY